MVRNVTLLAALVAASGARAQDAALARLIDQAAAASPEVAQARADVEAQRARIPQAGALPDPTLTLGIQNDGFQQIQIGTMETSYYQIMLTQPLYWPGKRGLREQVASLDARRAEARFSRAMLDLEGSVRRSWLGLAAVRGQIELLDEQEQLWAHAEQAARSRYEAGQVPQSDLLRAQLERARLQQRRWALESERATRAAELNRLRARALDDALPTPPRLPELADPPLEAEAEAERDAESRSPELQLALAGVEQADRRVDLARRERFPDFALSAAIMPRGSLDPMWSLGVSIGLPIFSARKQNRAVDESAQRRVGEAQGAEAVRQVLRLRTRERLLTLAALNRSNRHYRTQVLVLSAAAARSTLSQYEVGRVPFASVLEALSGYVADRVNALSSIADAQSVAIAQREVSLDPVPAMTGAGATSPMPGTSGVPARASAATASAAAGAQPAAPQRGMGGM